MLPAGAARAPALGLERRALAHAKAMLLVDDRQAEALKHDARADHRVRPDHDLDLAGLDGGMDRALAGRREAARQELRANANASSNGASPR